uniref:Regulator of microtubule dynamics protein 1 n=1 Tax=Panagrolaimus sp. JU765 TaxID=591449 RepID=A0AC34R8I0_9BILA
MFRRTFAAGAKLIGGLASVQMGAAAVALTDKQLSKKPDWYQNGVKTLEESLKKLSTYAFIDSTETLDTAEHILYKVHDIENTELLWRLARVLAEKADMTKNEAEKKKLLHEAAKYAKKAIALEPGTGSAGAHKWYAYILCNLLKVEKHCKKDAKQLEEKVLVHLEKAAKLDPKDPFTLHLLGIHLFHNKDYKEAIKNFEKAESIKPNFSAANLYYLGETQRHLGKKAEATATLKKVLTLPTKYKFDSKAKSEAKRTLMVNLKQKLEDIEPKSDF